MIFRDVKMAASKQLAIRIHCSASLNEMAIALTLARFTNARSKMCLELDISEESGAWAWHSWESSVGVINATVGRNLRRRKPISFSRGGWKNSLYRSQNLKSCGRSCAEKLFLKGWNGWNR
jgi:hypothetical protein